MKKTAFLIIIALTAIVIFIQISPFQNTLNNSDSWPDIAAQYSKIFNSGIQKGNNISDFSYFALSDERLKDSIRNLNGDLAKVMKLRGVSYYWKDSTMGTKKQIGHIAQEIEKVYPEFVSTNKEGYKVVNYQQITAVLVEAIKELNHKVYRLEMENNNQRFSSSKSMNLEQRVKDLEFQMRQLKNDINKSQMNIDKRRPPIIEQKKE